MFLELYIIMTTVQIACLLYLVHGLSNEKKEVRLFDVIKAGLEEAIEYERKERIASVNKAVEKQKGFRSEGHYNGCICRSLGKTKTCGSCDD